MRTIEPGTAEGLADYVRNLEIEFPLEPFGGAKDVVDENLIKSGEEQAFLSDKSIVSFVSKVSGQAREDVLNSTLLAQLAAKIDF